MMKTDIEDEDELPDDFGEVDFATIEAQPWFQAMRGAFENAQELPPLEDMTDE